MKSGFHALRFSEKVVIPSIQVGFFNLPSPKLLIIEELDNKIRASPYRGGRQCLPIFSFSWFPFWFQLVACSSNLFKKINIINDLPFFPSHRKYPCKKWPSACNQSLYNSGQRYSVVKEQEGRVQTIPSWGSCGKDISMPIICAAFVKKPPKVSRTSW